MDANVIAEREVIEIAMDRLENLWRPGSPKVLYPGDYIYHLPSQEKILETAAYSQKPKRDKFIENTRDCDDFAFDMKAVFCNAAPREKQPFAYCFGVAWLNSPFGHALNWAIDEEKKFLLFEPQQRAFVPVENYDDFYLLVI